MPELWYPGATVRLGPENKTWGTKDVFGLTCHSSEGNFSGDMAMLDSQVRPRGSWTLYNPRSGPMLQHYPLNAITWHAGARDSWGTIGIESEGFWDEPLTASQNGNLVEFFAWCRENFEWHSLILNINLFEHNFWRATSCPSGRYLWDVLIPLANAIGGEYMASAEYEELQEKIKAVQSAHSEAIWKLAQHAMSIDEQLGDIVDTTSALGRAVAQHFQTHNTGGSIVEKHGMVILEEVTKLVKKTEESRTVLVGELALLREFIAEGGTNV